MDEKLIRDGLYRLDKVAMTQDHIGQGVVFGIVTGIMATTNMTLEEALQLCRKNAPKNVRPFCIL